MNGLPAMRYDGGIRQYQQTIFQGYDHNLSAGEGAIWDMENLTGELYPLLSPRKPRYLLETLTAPNGFYAKDGLYWVDGTGFYAGGAQKGTVENSRKQFTALGAYILIFPDKAFYNVLTGDFGSLEASWTGAATIQDGTYAGESAAANTIYAAGADWGDFFQAGDALTISGAVEHPENNQTIIVREIEGDYLRFYENSFVLGEGGDSETLTISREMPDLDFVCENENRLWGCKGDSIYASKLGDPFNWNVFDGLSTDSYAVQVGSAGDFTACCSYLGYPVFFKDAHIYKVYGDRPSNFQVMGSASLGVEAGSHRSLAIAGETLFYLSRAGVVAYAGGIPQSIAAPFGTDRYQNAVGGSDGLKYYVSMQQGADWSLFVYDSQRRLWHREDGRQILDFGWDGELYFLDSTGKLWLDGKARTVPAGAVSEGTVESMAEFGDFTEGSPNKKGTVRFLLRTTLESGARLKLSIRYDSMGDWQEIEQLSATQKRSFITPVVPRRCDHFRLKLEGTGMWQLYGITREAYIGSSMKSIGGRQ